MAKRKITTISDFYCLNCGNRGIPIQRPKSRQRGYQHRKKLYCPTCQLEVNHIECRNDSEIWTFKRQFENGNFKQEAAESISYIKEETL